MTQPIRSPFDWNTGEPSIFAKDYRYATGNNMARVPSVESRVEYKPKEKGPNRKQKKESTFASFNEKI
jgi:hypothetical protein